MAIVSWVGLTKLHNAIISYLLSHFRWTWCNIAAVFKHWGFYVD